MAEPTGKEASHKPEEIAARKQQVLVQMALCGYYALAGKQAGVAKSTIKRWLDSDADFAAAMDDAKAEFTAGLFESVAASAGAKPEIGMKLLEKLDRETFGNQVQHNVNAQVQIQTLIPRAQRLSPMQITELPQLVATEPDDDDEVVGDYLDLDDDE